MFFIQPLRRDDLAIDAALLSPVTLINGFIPKRHVEAWAELREEELLADWQLLEQGRKPVEQDGWYLARSRGSHRHFKHPDWHRHYRRPPEC